MEMGEKELGKRHATLVFVLRVLRVCFGISISLILFFSPLPLYLASELLGRNQFRVYTYTGARCACRRMDLAACTCVCMLIVFGAFWVR